MEEKLSERHGKNKGGELIKEKVAGEREEKELSQAAFFLLFSFFFFVCMNVCVLGLAFLTSKSSA